MDTRTGEIISREEAESRNRQLAEMGFGPACKPMNIQPIEQQMNRKPPKIGRNDPCPCGSNVKFKHCCIQKLSLTDRILPRKRRKRT